jgi:uncharacterized protein involved in exopolysaccharide biosynthesis
VSTAANEFDPDDPIDLRAFAARLWSRRLWIVASVILFTAAFAAVALRMTPIYRTATVFVSASVGSSGIRQLLGGALGSLGDLAPLAGINVGSGSVETEESLAVLKSRHFTEAFIEDRHLMPELFPTKWDVQNRKWKTDVVPPTPAQAYKYFNNTIRSVLQDKKTGLITLQIDWRDRTEAAEWANDLLKRVNAEMRSRAIGSASASVGYLEKELNTTSVVDTREAISRLMEAQINKRMLANVTEEYAFRVVDRAMAPDKKDVFKPKKLLLLVAGFALGALVGVVGVLLVDGVDRKRVLPSARA